MQPTDDRGVLLNYDRNAPKYDTTGILQELIGNRKHGVPSPDGTNTFMFATFQHERSPWMVIGSSQLRSRENINHELTPYRANLRTVGESSRIREKGFGAKLPYFHFRGSVSILYQTNPQETFSAIESDWKATRETDFDELSMNLNNKEEDFNIHAHTPLHRVATHEEVRLFWRLPGIVESKLMEFVRTSNLRSFYVYRNYSVKADLDDHIQRIATIYEGTDVRILRSIDGGEPIEISPISCIGLGLLPKYWEHSLVVHCKLGTVEKQFHDTRLKICLPSRDMYIKLVPNGKPTNPTLNLTEDKTASWETSDADIDVTIAKLSKEYIDREPERSAAKYVGQRNSMLSRMAFLSLEGDILSDKPNSDDDVGVSIRAALLKYDGRFRVLVNIRKETVKDNLNSGLHIEPFKRDSKLQAKRGIHECIKKACTIFSRCFDTEFDDASILEASDALARHRKVSKQRSSEGKKYEQIVTDDLTNRFDSMTWYTGDASIQARHGLSGQGIDTLGLWGGSEESPSCCAAVQIKDVTTLTVKEVEKFTTTVQELQSKFPEMMIFPFLIWKTPKDSIPTSIYTKLDEINGRLVFDSMGVCDRIERELAGYELE